MDTAEADVKRLMAEVEQLRAEVALLRSQQAAHVCPSVPPVPVPGTMWPGIIWKSPFVNACAGGGYVPPLVLNNTCAAQITIPAAPTGMAAGCAGAAVQTFSVIV
jgi:hypothetical protein